MIQKASSRPCFWLLTPQTHLYPHLWMRFGRQAMLVAKNSLAKTANFSSESVRESFVNQNQHGKASTPRGCRRNKNHMGTQAQCAQQKQHSHRWDTGFLKPFLAPPYLVSYLHLCKSWVHHVVDPVNGETGLCDICGNHNFPLAGRGRLEDSRLDLTGQRTEHREDKQFWNLGAQHDGG